MVYKSGRRLRLIHRSGEIASEAPWISVEDGSELRLLTNNPALSASAIAEICKDRWEIEIFFKTIKQNLKIKTFVGATRNALLIQIRTALTAILPLKHLQFKSRLSWSFSNLVAMLCRNLFVHRCLWAWLDNMHLAVEPPFVLDISWLPPRAPLPGG